jgi:uncharacterized protein YwgA
VSQQEKHLSAEDWVLALLSVVDKPIYGRLMLVKEVFLIAKEIDTTLDKELSFFPYDLGPYSKVLAQKLNEMVSKELIEANSNVGEEGDFVFSLTSKGRQEAQRVLGQLSPEVQELLRKKRRGWDQLGYRGIVRLVYSKYPEYAGRSRIREVAE